MSDLAQYDMRWLRAWADAGIISVGMYAEEVDRRRTVARGRVCEALLTVDVVRNEIQSKEGGVHDYGDDCV